MALVGRLERRSPMVRLKDIRQAVIRRASGPLVPEAVEALVEAAVEDALLFTDRRTFYDRAQGTFRAVQVYRVNQRHPLPRAAANHGW